MMEDVIQSGSVSPAFKVRRRTSSDATWKNRPHVALELNEGAIGNSAIYRLNDCRLEFMAGVWQSYDRHVKAGMKKSAAAGESGEGRSTAGSGTGWSLTLSGSATGQPAEWTIAEAKLAPELKGSRREMIERMIRDTTVANLNTTNHSADEVQRGFELYAAINDSNSKKDASKMLKSLAAPDPKKTMSFFLENMRSTIKRVLAFANLLPGFSELEKEDRVTLFKQGSFEVIVTRYARLFTGDGMFTPDMTTLIPRNLVHKMPLGELFVEQFDYADHFNRLGLNDAEIGLVCAVMLFNPDRVGLHNRAAVQKLQSLYLQCLYVYLKGQQPDDYDALFSRTLDVLPLMASVNESHARTMNELKRGGYGPGFPDLHNEVFQ